MTIVLSPSPVTTVDKRGSGPPAGSIAGKKVGLRRDQFWLSWDWVTDEWAKALKDDGAEPVIWRAPVGKGDKEMAEGGEEFEAFLDDIDVAISGLCNCGSCTLWAIHDTVAALDHGLPTVAVSTEHFEPLARTLAGQGGWDDLRLKLMPYPLEGRPEDEVRAIAREHYPELLEVLEVVR
ncbi:MAG: hypothetical protein ACHQDC_07360 [Acidimicrobiales bacterium]|jgi:hypothetical protein